MELSPNPHYSGGS